MCNTPRTCLGNMHERCSDCQNAVRRETKRRKNNYRAHGPCQSVSTRTWRRNLKSSPA